LSQELTGVYNAFGHIRNNSPLSNNDDWNFRVKVISSTTNLQDDDFQKAVQDLVKICFPHGVLKELGVDLLENQMRAEKAPEKNVARMVKVYRAEMTRRVSQMLAEYLDTPVKVQQGVECVIEARPSAYFALCDNILGDTLPLVCHKSHTVRAPIRKTLTILGKSLLPLMDHLSWVHSPSAMAFPLKK
jgi:hypothetical protein